MAYYFKHDDNARRDPKLIRLRRIKGMSGLGIYWCLIEIMHEENGILKHDEISSLAFELGVEETLLFSVLKEFDLFIFEDGCYRNARVMQSLCERMEKSERAVRSANKRWGNKSEKLSPDNQSVNASALPTQSYRNAIREEKIKEDKRKIAPLAFDFKSALINFGFDEKLVSEWLLVRKNKKATNTETAYKKFISEINALDKRYPINEVMSHMVSKSWSGFKKTWLEQDFKMGDNSVRPMVY